VALEAIEAADDAADTKLALVELLLLAATDSAATV
jgi:hypothetical protein